MPTKGIMRPVPISLLDEQIAYLDEVANRDGKSRAEIVRELIDRDREGATA